MKLFAAVLALVNANAMDERLAIISGHVDRLADATLDMTDKKDARYVSKLGAWMDALVVANGDRDGAECDAEVVEEEDDITVFSEDDYCKLNSQINSALSSAARKWACDGRGNVSRQAVRRLKKVKNLYNRQHCE
ncbi:unnamed protein product [Oikopleura dioica]|uniref:Oikosin 38 n=1 Tax=Oikopleura dioica TaxID=34765 RepID=E4XRC6_OIKDI|nr:unnamed protein product [Oikopleura dioica]CCG47887.1 oikosin 38 [Oikopleura dioica]